MAKAGRKSTPKTVGECSEAELNEMLRRAMEEDFQNRPEYWAAARAEAAALKKASKTLDRAIAIQMGVIPPPWASKLLAKLPVGPPPKAPTGAGAWIKSEVLRMKAAGEISEGTRISITDFAKLLEKRLKAAARADNSLRVVGWRHIKNSLPGLRLWPISSIE